MDGTVFVLLVASFTLGLLPRRYNVHCAAPPGYPDPLATHYQQTGQNPNRNARLGSFELYRCENGTLAFRRRKPKNTERSRSSFVSFPQNEDIYTHLERSILQGRPSSQGSYGGSSRTTTRSNPSRGGIDRHIHQHIFSQRDSMDSYSQQSPTSRTSYSTNKESTSSRTHYGLTGGQPNIQSDSRRSHSSGRAQQSHAPIETPTKPSHGHHTSFFQRIQHHESKLKGSQGTGHTQSQDEPRFGHRQGSSYSDGYSIPRAESNIDTSPHIGPSYMSSNSRRPQNPRQMSPSTLGTYETKHNFRSYESVQTSNTPAPRVDTYVSRHDTTNAKITSDDNFDNFLQNLGLSSQGSAQPSDRSSYKPTHDSPSRHSSEGLTTAPSTQYDTQPQTDPAQQLTAARGTGYGDIARIDNARQSGYNLQKYGYISPHEQSTPPPTRENTYRSYQVSYGSANNQPRKSGYNLIRERTTLSPARRGSRVSGYDLAHEQTTYSPQTRENTKYRSYGSSYGSTNDRPRISGYDSIQERTTSSPLNRRMTRLRSYGYSYPRKSSSGSVQEHTTMSPSNRQNIGFRFYGSTNNDREFGYDLNKDHTTSTPASREHIRYRSYGDSYGSTNNEHREYGHGLINQHTTQRPVIRENPSYRSYGSPNDQPRDRGYGIINQHTTQRPVIRENPSYRSYGSPNDQPRDRGYGIIYEHTTQTPMSRENTRYRSYGSSYGSMNHRPRDSNHGLNQEHTTQTPVIEDRYRSYQGSSYGSPNEQPAPPAQTRDKHTPYGTSYGSSNGQPREINHIPGHEYTTTASPNRDNIGYRPYGSSYGSTNDRLREPSYESIREHTTLIPRARESSSYRSYGNSFESTTKQLRAINPDSVHECTTTVSPNREINRYQPYGSSYGPTNNQPRASSYGSISEHTTSIPENRESSRHRSYGPSYGQLRNSTNKQSTTPPSTVYSSNYQQRLQDYGNDIIMNNILNQPSDIVHDTHMSNTRQVVSDKTTVKPPSNNMETPHGSLQAHQQLLHGSLQAHQQSLHGSLQAHQQSLHGSLQAHEQSLHGSLQAHQQSSHGSLQAHQQSSHDSLRAHQQSLHGSLQAHEQSLHGSLQAYQQSLHGSLQAHGNTLNRPSSSDNQDATLTTNSLNIIQPNHKINDNLPHGDTMLHSLLDIDQHFTIGQFNGVPNFAINGNLDGYISETGPPALNNNNLPVHYSGPDYNQPETNPPVGQLAERKYGSETRPNQPAGQLVGGQYSLTMPVSTTLPRSRGEETGTTIRPSSTYQNQHPNNGHRSGPTTRSYPEQTHTETTVRSSTFSHPKQLNTEQTTNGPSTFSYPTQPNTETTTGPSTLSYSKQPSKETTHGSSTLSYSKQPSTETTTGPSTLSYSKQPNTKTTNRPSTLSYSKQPNTETTHGPSTLSYSKNGPSTLPHANQLLTVQINGRSSWSSYQQSGNERTLSSYKQPSESTTTQFPWSYNHLHHNELPHAQPTLSYHHLSNTLSSLTFQ